MTEPREIHLGDFVALADLLEGLSKLERAKAKASPKKRARTPKKPARKGARK